MTIAVALASVLAGAGGAQAQDRGAAIYAEQCARCHDLPDSRAPSRATLEQMSVNRIVRTMDFGAMMSVTYMLDRDDRQAVAEYLGVPGEDREPPAEAYCADRSVDLAAARNTAPGDSRAISAPFALAAAAPGNSKTFVVTINSGAVSPSCVNSVTVACDGGDGPLGHPRVFLNVGKEGQIECPYCSRRYVLKAGAARGH